MFCLQFVLTVWQYLIKEGFLNKISRKERQPRMFFLMNDVLLYTAPFTHATFALRNVLPLVGMRLRVTSAAVDDDEESANVFSILSTHRCVLLLLSHLTRDDNMYGCVVFVGRSFAVQAESAAERDAWVNALREAIDDNNEKRKTFVPDAHIASPLVQVRVQYSPFLTLPGMSLNSVLFISTGWKSREK